MEKYDIAIIGGGISGLMAAYRLNERNSELSIVVIEKGHELESRDCPKLKKAVKCFDCNPCSIMNGLAGAGAFSDGKFIISADYGGKLSDFIGSEKALHYMKEADYILNTFGATDICYTPNENLNDICRENNLILKSGVVKHFGTENNMSIMKALISHLQACCNFITDCIVTDVNAKEHIILSSNHDAIYAENIVFAVGRSGNEFLADWCKKNGIAVSSNSVDIGVRVELKSQVWEHISNIAYDPKISYISKMYGDETRMFCFNAGGHVVLENTNGIKTVNGHAYSNKDLKSENSNFALLTTIKFSEPFCSPNEYVKHIANCANFIGNGGVLIQRFGDLTNGRRTTPERLAESSIKPTLNAYPGDLSLCIPKRQLDSIIETIFKLDTIAPGTSNEDTLLYGVEGKYYSAAPDMNEFEIKGCSKIYACGDGSGVTRSLAQAAGNGLYIADILDV